MIFYFTENRKSTEFLFITFSALTLKTKSNEKINTIIIMSMSVFGQSKVEFTKGGITPIVTEVEGMTAEQLYNKTKEWVQNTFKNPNEVLKADVANDMIRINGYQQNFFWVRSIIKQYYNLSYSLEFNFKDGKYRTTFTSDRISHDNTANVVFSESDFFKKEGEVRKVYADAHKSYVESVEALLKSHNDYITGKSADSKKDW